MEILQKLFGSISKVKVMRLFIFNPESTYDLKTIRERTHLTSYEVKKEVSLLTKMGLIKKKSTRRHGPLWMLDETFQYLSHLNQLMMETVISERDEIAKRIARTCRLKALVFSGFFINNSDSRADILIVGQSAKKAALKRTIKKIESEIGKEIRYVILDQPDFNYRKSIGDKLVRDVFDYPHVIAYDRLGIAGAA